MANKLYQYILTEKCTKFKNVYHGQYVYSSGILKIIKYSSLHYNFKLFKSFLPTLYYYIRFSDTLQIVHIWFSQTITIVGILEKYITIQFWMMFKLIFSNIHWIHLSYKFKNIVKSANINSHLFDFYFSIETMTHDRPYLYSKILLKILVVKNNYISKIFIFKYSFNY